MNQEVMFSSKRDDWETPQAFFDKLDAEFHFTLDPCSTHENAKCKKHFTKAEDGLKQSWAGETVFCNPPYGKEQIRWIEKAVSSIGGGTKIVMLLPARTDTRAFHDLILPRSKEIRFIRGRLKFGDGKSPAPFPSMLVIF